MKKRILALFLAAVICLAAFTGCGDIANSLLESDGQDYGYSFVYESEAPDNESNISQNQEGGQSTIDENGEYTSKDDVALYIHTYSHLPSNFITKNEAKDLGWQSSEGNLWDIAPGMSVGGDRFGNREGLLPDAEGRKWYECDINFSGGFRGAERIVYSNDGLIYYTSDHYESFTQLY